MLEGALAVPASDVNSRSSTTTALATLSIFRAYPVLAGATLAAVPEYVQSEHFHPP
jgi:hypothetical protein